MKSKYIIIYILIFTLLLGGCSLARPDAGEGDSAGRDKLIGCFITTEYIDTFDFEAYFNDHASDFVNGGEVVIDNTADYNGRIYAQMVEEYFTDSMGETHSTWSFEFTGLEGVAYFAPYIEKDGESYTTFVTGEGLQNVHNKVNSTDFGNWAELSARLYVPVDTENELVGDEFCYYMNPVYQAGDGSVYLVPGSGYASNLTAPGIEMTTKLHEEVSHTTNGVTTELVSSVEIECVAVYVPTSVTVIQMAKDGVVLAVESFLPEELPEEYMPEAGCEYIIMETHAFDSEGNDVIERATIAPDTEDCNIFVLVPGDNGFMSMVISEVLWE